MIHNETLKPAWMCLERYHQMNDHKKRHTDLSEVFSHNCSMRQHVDDKVWNMRLSDLSQQWNGWLMVLALKDHEGFDKISFQL